MLRLGSHFHATIPSITYVPIPVNISNKYLGIIVSNNLNFSSHLNRKVNVAHAHSNLILHAFPFSDIPIRCKLLCTYILEYCSPIWSSYTLENIELIENIQFSFT